MMIEHGLWGGDSHLRLQLSSLPPRLRDLRGSLRDGTGRIWLRRSCPGHAASRGCVRQIERRKTSAERTHLPSSNVPWRPASPSAPYTRTHAGQKKGGGVV